jgi:hypothetical protein
MICFFSVVLQIFAQTETPGQRVFAGECKDGLSGVKVFRLLPLRDALRAAIGGREKPKLKSVRD